MEAVAVASGTLMMTADDARRTVEQIKEGMENVRGLLLDLYEREGWRALGYDSFVECAQAEFDASKSQAYRLLNAARLDGILSPIGENGSLPETHLRELKVVADEPEAAREIVKKVRALKGGDMHAEDIRSGVDEHLGRPARAARTKPERRSVSSRAEAGDFEDAAPAYEDQSQEPYGEALSAEKWCQVRGGKYRGETCPCQTVPAPMEGASDDRATEPAGHGAAVAAVVERPAGAAAASDQAPAGDEGDPFDCMRPHPDGVSAPIPADPALLNGTPTADRPEVAESQGAAPSPVAVAAAVEIGDSAPASAPPAAPITSPTVTAGRPAPGISAGLGKRAVAAPLPYHPVIVDGVAPQPVYPTADGLLNAIESHLAGDALDELAQRFGAYYRDVKRRRAQATGQPETVPGATLNEADETVQQLTPGQQMALVSRIFRRLPLDQQRNVAAMASTHVAAIDNPAAVAATWAR